MTCVEARDLLPEFAVGVLDDGERVRVERHLQWCAGCRKEAAELGSAAATFAYSLPQASVPSGLSDRVVRGIQRAAAAPGSPRRWRTLAVATVAGLVALTGLGWGAVMAGRAERYADRALNAEVRQAEALDRFQRVLASIVPGAELPQQETFLGRLAPEKEFGGGAVLQLVSDTRIDFVLVIVNGLESDDQTLPYRVRLSTSGGDVLKAGRIEELDADGGAELFRQFEDASLEGFTHVAVLDAQGDVVLSGSVDQSPGAP